MNDTELKAAIQELPLSPSERNSVLALARPPNPIYLVLAAISAVLAISHLFTGWEGLHFAHHSPPVDAAPIPAFHAFARARQVDSVYQGILWLVLAAANLKRYYSAAHLHRPMRFLVFRAIPPKSA